MKLTVVVLTVALVILVAEPLAAYFDYRYYAHIKKPFEPKGSAVIDLIEHSVERVRGNHRQVQVTVDRSPLFEPNEELGFTLAPGEHRVTESYNGREHFFDLTVTAEGHRASSYEPVRKDRRLIITGDSTFFGWGVDDEETIPWLMQERLPDMQIVNLTLNSYGTIQALLQLRRIEPALGAKDVVVLTYHPVTNDFNVAAPDVLRHLAIGYEVQVGDTKRLRAMALPYAVIAPTGEVAIQRVSLTCASPETAAGCNHPDVPTAEAQEVTKRLFDDVLTLRAGRVVVAFIFGEDNDPVIAYLRSKGVSIADLRAVNGYPEEDVIATDLHAGAFWHHQHYNLLLEAMRRAGIVDLGS